MEELRWTFRYLYFGKFYVGHTIWFRDS